MKLFPLVVAVVACLLFPNPAKAQAAPFTLDKEYSADVVLTEGHGNGNVHKSTSYVDNGKIRMDMNEKGMPVAMIMRPDQGKIYTVMPTQNMAMVIPLDATEQNVMAMSAGGDAKFDTVGPDAVDGVACTKYKMTTSDGKIYFWWVSAADKTPVKLTPENGSTTIVFKNYKAGPQDAALFELPAGCQIMNAPGGMPGGGAPPAPAAPPGQ
jgi:hypothetical protein